MAIFGRKKERDAEEANREQMQRRQSAPQPTFLGAVSGITSMGKSGQYGQGKIETAAMDGFEALERVIGREQVQAANLTLQKYKAGKANLEARVVANEEWYKLRHWECMRGEKNQVEPTSAWLFNCIANKHADAMDNFPTANILPRESGDKGEAAMLTAILPVVMDQCDFEDTYDEISLSKLKSGTGIYGVFWDSSKLGGLGDIAIEEIDIVNLFWEPGVTDIQRSGNVFHVELVDNRELELEYPQLKGKLGTGTVNVTKYLYDDTVDTSEKSTVVDWYYKRRDANGRMVLHYCKYVNDEVLFATENEKAYAGVGWYAHGQYPFVTDALFKVKGSLAGFGYIDVCKSSQEYIDRGNQAIMQNMLHNAKPRHFVSDSTNVNMEEYADLNNEFVHVSGPVKEDTIKPIVGKPLNSIYVNVVKDKVDEMKETAGNRDISTGGTSSGVTAASAIAAMQEAGSKLSRDTNKASYRAYRKVVLMVIELIRQFYNEARCFRIMGQDGMERYVQYSNAGIRPQDQGVDFGKDMGVRVPLFDIEVTAQKASPYSKLGQNELALQFLSAGFFIPQNADQALACLEMMDFDRKEFVMQRIAQNGGMLQQMMAMQQQMMLLAQMVDEGKGSNFTAQLAAQFGIQAPVAGETPGAAQAENTEALGGKEGKAESGTTKKARQRVAESTAPT